MSTPEQPGSAGNGRPAQTQSPAQPPAPRPPTAAWPPVEQDGSRPNHQDAPRQGPQDGPRPAPQDAPRQGPRPARTDGASQQRQPEPPRQPEPQRQPQTNLPPRGSDQTRPEQTRQEPNRTTVQPAARAVDGQKAPERPRQSRPAEATAKAAVIDGPTRNIARNDLPTDMPDLSTVRHPMHEEQRSERQAPVAVAQPVGSGDPLRATVQIRKIDPWSMLKLSLVISVSLFFVWMVAVGLLYMVLDGMGVWDRLNNAFSDIVATSGESGLVSAGQIFGYAAVIGLINVVLFTALTTIGTFIYNLCSDLVGGLEVTLADRD